MGPLDRRRRRRAQQQLADLLVDTTLPVVKNDSSFEGEDGSTIYSLGYTILDPIGEFTRLGEDNWLREVGCRLAKVAGLTHHAEAGQDERFAPGSVVVLCPDPRNPADPDAVGVWDASGELQVGFVPADLAPEIARRIAGDELLGGAILREYRSAPEGGRRLGLVMLIAPVGKVTLSVERRDGAPEAAEEPAG